MSPPGPAPVSMHQPESLGAYQASHPRLRESSSIIPLIIIPRPACTACNDNCKHKIGQTHPYIPVHPINCKKIYTTSVALEPEHIILPSTCNKTLTQQDHASTYTSPNPFQFTTAQNRIFRTPRCNAAARNAPGGQGCLCQRPSSCLLLLSPHRRCPCWLRLTPRQHHPQQHQQK